MRKLIFGLLLRLPVYVLPLALFFIEGVIRRSANQPYGLDILAPAILSAGLGLAASVITSDLPQVAFAALSPARQTVLRCCAGVGCVLFFLGLCLWMEIVLELMRHQPISSLPVLIARPLFWGDLGLALTYAISFYVVCLFTNEIRAGACS